MIERGTEVPVKRQAQLLQLSRSSVYYEARPISDRDLALMRRIDELHLQLPYYGARKLAAQLRREGHEVGRRHVTTLMRRMGIEALYRKPRTSIPARSCDLSVSALGSCDRTAEPGLGVRHYVFADGTRLYVPGRDPGCGEPQSAELSALEHADGGLQKPLNT